MKPTIDPDAVVALAQRAFERLLKHEWSNMDDHPLEEIVGEVFGIDDLIAANPGPIAKECAPILDAFKIGLMVGLHLGARIGVDPYHLPKIGDLIDKYRFEAKDAAA